MMEIEADSSLRLSSYFPAASSSSTLTGTDSIPFGHVEISQQMRLLPERTESYDSRSHSYSPDPD